MDTFITFIDGMIEEFKLKEQELLSSGCKDEANFAKIKINICDICKTLYNASLKRVSVTRTPAMSEEEFNARLREDYVSFLTRIPENWKNSYEKAKEHGDVERIIIEEIKLEVLQIIKDKFEELIKS